MIGDVDPEDAYDADDPVSHCLDVLERIIIALEEDPSEPRRDSRRVDALRLANQLEARVGADLIRARLLRDALSEM